MHRPDLRNPRQRVLACKHRPFSLQNHEPGSQQASGKPAPQNQPRQRPDRKTTNRTNRTNEERSFRKGV